MCQIERTKRGEQKKIKIGMHKQWEGGENAGVWKDKTGHFHFSTWISSCPLWRPPPPPHSFLPHLHTGPSHFPPAFGSWFEFRQGTVSQVHGTAEVYSRWFVLATLGVSSQGDFFFFCRQTKQQAEKKQSQMEVWFVRLGELRVWAAD